MHDIAIFLGPTLGHRVAQRILDVQYLPPIKRGDLNRLGPGVKVVGIVDGEFYQNLAVSLKEILGALERGILLYGSSSIGALRAAETCKFGMIGVGEVFRAYRDGEIDADDEVAVTYDPETYKTMSEPLVNMRHALKAAVKRHIVSLHTASEMLRYLKNLYFPFRSYSQLAQVFPQYRGFLLTPQPDLKADDAKLLLEHIALLHVRAST